eukprot:CAMPEP_0115096946 /NCGR_PEP_ID=MMETSP0227-20121206/30106_1 /TAXON_ID=89957 /ORGANISM="Polarella glacialis, Strain CCMP 1383" /LENGTH=43 /DNA_ID= /DNA_START= /DNA_END= /DNA_ORIENTATION=
MLSTFCAEFKKECLLIDLDPKQSDKHATNNNHTNNDNNNKTNN